MAQYLTTTELLAFLRVSRTTLYTLRIQGDFPAARKIGKRRLVWNADEVAAWAAAQ